MLLCWINLFGIISYPLYCWLYFFSEIYFGILQPLWLSFSTGMVCLFLSFYFYLVMSLYLKYIYKKLFIWLSHILVVVHRIFNLHCSIWGLLVLTGKFLVAHGIRDLVPWSSLGPLLWEHGVLAAGPPGKFLKYIYFTYPYSFSSVLPFFMEIHFLFSKELLTFLAKQIYWQQIPSVFCLSEGVCFSSTFEE